MPSELPPGGPTPSSAENPLGIPLSSLDIPPIGGRSSFGGGMPIFGRGGMPIFERGGMPIFGRGGNIPIGCGGISIFGRGMSIIFGRGGY